MYSMPNAIGTLIILLPFCLLASKNVDVLFACSKAVPDADLCTAMCTVLSDMLLSTTRG